MWCWCGPSNGQDIVLNLTESFFSVALKNLSNRLPSEPVDFVVGVEKFPTQFVRKSSSDSAFTGSHQTH
jgi:hypothetical protein